MSNNVVILGAGFSFDAGIPLLGRFVERMIDIATKRICNGAKVSQEDATTISDALEVRNELDGYHGRISFNDRNIEDILSILQFNQLAGDTLAESKLSAMNRAIAKTINLTCKIQRPFKLDTILSDHDHGIYSQLWGSLFSLKSKNIDFPSFITFNYDLVLERSLINTLIRFIGVRDDRDNPFFPYRGVSVEYHNSNMSEMHYKGQIHGLTFSERGRSHGYFLENISESNTEFLSVEILKPHGSLNFPSDNNLIKKPDICSSCDNPLILPPVFNKMKSGFGEEIWKNSIKRLRSAKTVTIIGYSMPQSDIYMQYFLKSGLGPNRGHDRVTVFDPVLFKEGQNSSDMRERYSKCFSPQLQERINFNPPHSTGMGQPGTLKHFNSLLTSSPESVFF